MRNLNKHMHIVFYKNLMVFMDDKEIWRSGDKMRSFFKTLKSTISNTESRW